jgi:outer membrane protein TolC
MNQPLCLFQRLPLRLATGLGLPLIFTLPALAQTEPVTDVPAEINPIVTPAQVPTLGLAECVQLALQRQPALAASRASLAAAQQGLRGVNNLRVPTFIARDLPIRRRQACLGVNAAAAAVHQSEHETVYAVVRTYFSVLYAREQQRVASDVADHLSGTLSVATAQLKAGTREATKASVDKTTVYLRLAQSRQAEAARGIREATAALKEAIGLGPETSLQVPDERLPDPQLTINKDEIVALAVSRRGELAQAGLLADITGLEVCAQSKSCHPQFRTFAAAADIHAHNVPEGVSDTEYRPGAVPPEMPTTLVGSRAVRMDHARALSARAGAVTEKTRNLIGLEAEDAYYRWEEAAQKIIHTREAADKGSKLADSTRNDYTSGQNVKVEDVLTNEVLAAQARSQHVEALYRQVLALAALERITAGGFSAGLMPQPASSADQTPPASGDGDAR